MSHQGISARSRAGAWQAAVAGGIADGPEQLTALSRRIMRRQKDSWRPIDSTWIDRTPAFKPGAMARTRCRRFSAACAAVLTPIYRRWPRPQSIGLPAIGRRGAKPLRQGPRDRDRRGRSRAGIGRSRRRAARARARAGRNTRRRRALRRAREARLSPPATWHLRPACRRCGTAASCVRTMGLAQRPGAGSPPGAARCNALPWAPCTGAAWRPAYGAARWIAALSLATFGDRS
jgi:hypothetical protein